MKTSILAALLGVVGLASTSAFAIDAAAPASPTPKPTVSATPTPTPTVAATPTPTMTAKPGKAELRERAQECSKEADALGKHGKERRNFREKCKHGVK
jgi:hypothetical protein